MKFVTTFGALLVGWNTIALAQTNASPAHKPVAKPAMTAPAAPTATRNPSPAPRDVQRDAQRELAQQFYSGFLSCELGKFVILTPDERTPGTFVMSHKGQQHRVAPVVSRTGTLRMEDSRGQVVWIQLPHKSMLMDQQAGVRLADECKSPEQELVAKSYNPNPPQELLDSLKPGTIEARNAARRAEPLVVTPIPRTQVTPQSTPRGINAPDFFRRTHHVASLPSPRCRTRCFGDSPVAPVRQANRRID